MGDRQVWQALQGCFGALVDIDMLSARLQRALPLDCPAIEALAQLRNVTHTVDELIQARNLESAYNLLRDGDALAAFAGELGVSAPQTLALRQLLTTASERVATIALRPG